MATSDGHGLGLSIVDAVVDAHGATMQVAPNPAGGLRITVTFPGSAGPGAPWTC